jgi:hypothetical protein
MHVSFMRRLLQAPDTTAEPTRTQNDLKMSRDARAFVPFEVKRGGSPQFQCLLDGLPPFMVA